MKKFFQFLITAMCLVLGSACTELRVKKYQDILNPKLGASKKLEINRLLGEPAYCKQENRYEKCEYRTASASNVQVPSVMRKVEGMGPDLSPYEYFDVLYLYYDSFHTLREWEPIVLVP